MRQQLRQLLIENTAIKLLFGIVGLAWASIVPFGPDGSARTWGMILTGYPLMILAIFLLRKPAVARVRALKFVLWAIIVTGFFWTLMLLVGLIDGTSVLECWRSTLASSC